MDQTDVNIKVNVDNKSINDLNNQLKDLTEQWKSVSVGSEEFKSLGKQIDTVSGKITSAGANIDQFGGVMKALPGVLGQVAGQVGVVNESLLALAANPIGAVIAAVGIILIALINEFSKFEAVSDSLGAAWEQVSSIFSIFASKILGPLVDGFVQLVDVVANAISTFSSFLGLDIESGSKRIGELAKEIDNLKDAQADLNLKIAESGTQLAKAREIAVDHTKSTKERIEALKEANRIEKQNADALIVNNKNIAKAYAEQEAIKMGANAATILAIRVGTDEQRKAAVESLKNLKAFNQNSYDEIQGNFAKVENLITTSATRDRQFLRDQNKINAEDANEKKEEQKKAEEEAKKSAEERKKRVQENAKNGLEDLIESHQKLIAAEKDFTQEKENQVLAGIEAEQDYYDQHYKELGITEAEANKKIRELEKQSDAEKKRFAKEQLDRQTADIAAKDNIDILDAKNEQDLLKARLKKIEDNRAQRVKDEKLTANQILEINRQALEDSNKLIQDKDIADQQKDIDADNREINRINQEKENANNTITDKIELNNTLKRINDEYLDAQLQLEKDTYDTQIEKANGNAQEIEKIEKDHALKVNKIKSDAAKTDKEISKNKAEALNTDIESYGGAVTAFKGFAKEGTDTAKAFAIADATIGTYTAISKTLSAFAGVPVPGYAIAQAIATGVFGLAQVAKIIGTDTPGGGSGGGSAPSASAVTQFSAPQMFGIGSQQINSLQDYSAQKVYVTESDITKSQNRVKIIQNASILGR
jgi:hypothetical protein